MCDMRQIVREASIFDAGTLLLHHGDANPKGSHVPI